MEVTPGPTNIIYRVDDRTGPWVKVQKWVSEQDSGEQGEQLTVQEGMYVRIVGHLKVFNKQRSVTAFYVRPLTDFNELSHHLSEVMYAHLVATKGAPVVSGLWRYSFHQGQTVVDFLGGGVRVQGMTAINL